MKTNLPLTTSLFLLLIGLVLLAGACQPAPAGATPQASQPVYLPLVTSSPPAAASPLIAGCPIFPPDHIWNQPIADLPLDPNSALYVDTIGTEGHLQADFGAGLWNGAPIGIPFVIVTAAQPGVVV
ncbi:MAG: hypothetical protein JW862_16370, partial [Anaerolineales bacterium]|nr:hypothetical protein [Anaerolineales bacterium]